MRAPVDPFVLGRPGMQSRDPSFGQRVSSALKAAGFPEFQANRIGGRLDAGAVLIGRGVELGAEVAPGIGEVLSAAEARESGQRAMNAFRRQDFSDAALEGGMTGLNLIGALPIVGAGARAVKKGDQFRRSLSEAAPPGSPAQQAIEAGRIRGDHGLDDLRQADRLGQLENVVENRLTPMLSPAGHLNQLFDDASGRLETATTQVDEVLSRPDLPEKVRKVAQKHKERIARWRNHVESQLAPLRGLPPSERFARKLPTASVTHHNDLVTGHIRDLDRLLKREGQPGLAIDVDALFPANPGRAALEAKEARPVR